LELAKRTAKVHAMRFETLCNLIESATPAQLRSLAQLVLQLQGYSDVWISDGPYDGGTDLRLLTVPGNPLPIAVATSVERDWQKKIRQDAATIKTKLKLDRMIFIGSRRIPEDTFLSVQADIIRTSDVSVTRIDNQAIASLVTSKQALPAALEIFDLPATGGPRSTAPTDRRHDAAFAYAFFAPDAAAFRGAIRERCLMLALFHAGGEAPVDETCESAAQLLGMPPEEAPRLRADIDRLRQSGQLLGRNGTTQLPEGEIRTLDALRTLREHEQNELKRQIAGLLDAEGMRPLADAVAAAQRGLGALLIRQSKGLDSLEHIHAQVRRLRVELRAFGLRDGQQGEAVLMKLLDCARRSPLGRHLATGALYQALTALNRDAFFRSLDARSTSLVLDASVALPMFCALFHGSVQQRFFLVAEELHRRAQNLGLALQLPSVWLEEMASHLLLAIDYQGLAAAEPDSLRMSKNAYVAYYASRPTNAQSDDFPTFLASFGLTPPLIRRSATDYRGARTQLESSLRHQLAHYGIETVDTPYNVAHLQQVDRDWGWALHDLGWDPRPDILERHDKKVLAWLASLDPRHAPMLVTWDRLLKTVRPHHSPGGALDPLAVCELLSLIRGGSMPVETLRFTGLMLTEAEAERSAAVFDALVQIEKSGLSDARLVRAAVDFKSSYLQRHHDTPDVEEMTQEWHVLRPQAV
jgi:hypothetical protein